MEYFQILTYLCIVTKRDSQGKSYRWIGGNAGHYGQPG